jgi:hypothetical protein
MYDGSYPRQVPGHIQKWWTDRIGGLAPTASSRNFYKTIWDKPKHLLWFLMGDSTPSIHDGCCFNTVSGLWCAVGSSSNPFINAAGSVTAQEIISARFVTEATALQMAALSWPGKTTAQDCALPDIYTWCLADEHSSPIIKGVRPKFSEGPTPGVGIGNDNWLVGNVYSVPAERSMQPAKSPNGSTLLSNLVWKDPGQLHGQASGQRLTIQLTTSLGKGFEMTSIALDLDQAGKY